VTEVSDLHRRSPKSSKSPAKFEVHSATSDQHASIQEGSPALMKNFTDMTMRSITPNLLQTNMNGHNKANPEVIPYVAIEGRQNDTGKNTSCSFN
jgi:hypothetical protein